VISTGLLLTGLTTDAHANDLYSVRLETASRVLRSDGRSDTVVSAYVYDERGNVAPNGTRVIFSTTIGRLDTTVAVTDNGVARANLIAPDQPGEAVITANVEGARAVQARTSVRFTADAEKTEEETNWIRVEGDYVGYIADPTRRVIQANGKNGGAKITYRSLTVSADLLQYRVAENKLLASGNVTVETDGTKREFNVLRFDFNSQEGLAERLVDSKPVPYELRGPTLEEGVFAPGRFRPTSETWLPDDLGDASVTVVSRSLQLERDRRIQFRRATFYIDGKKTLSMPFHEMGLDQDSIFREQIIGLGAQGLTLDFPLYYDVRPSAVGTLHIRNSASVNGSVYGVRQGLSLDAVQTYSGKNNTNGTFEAIGITRPDWGLRFRHGQRLDKTTTANALVEFPSHKNLFVNTTLRRSYKTFALNATAAASRNPDQIDFNTGERGKVGGNVSGQLYLDTNPRIFLNEKSVTYAVQVGVARNSYYGSSGLVRGAINSQTVKTRLNTQPYKIGRETTLSQSFAVGQTWLQGGASAGTGSVASTGGAEGLALDALTQVNRNVDKLGTVGLSYQYRQEPLPPGLGPEFANPKHLVTLSSYMSGNLGSKKQLPYQFQLLASRSLDRPQSNLTAGTRFSLGGPWSGQVRFTHASFSTFSYQETEYAIVRRIASRDFAIYYSTLSRRFQLDLSGARF
jgi:hypothetical protein